MNKEYYPSAMSRLATVLTGVIPKVTKDGKVNLPVYSFPVHSERHDLNGAINNDLAKGLIGDAERDREILGIDTLFEKGVASGAITIAASSQTPKRLKNGGDHSAHLVSWWWEKDTGRRKNILDLTSESEENIEDYIGVINQGVVKSAFYLNEILPNDVISVYGLAGHTDKKEREKTGLGKGTQTNPFGHVNVVCHDFDHYEKIHQREATLGETLKQIGPMDVVIMEKWGDIFVGMMNDMLRKKGIKGEVFIENRNQVDEITHKISFTNNIKISFAENMELGSVFRFLIPTINRFKELYTAVFSSYEKTFTNLGNPAKQIEIRKQFIEDTGNLGLSSDIASEMLDFALSFHPTLGQVNTWLEDSNLGPDSRRKLEIMKKRYEKIKGKIKERDVKGDFTRVSNYLVSQMLGKVEEGKMPEYVWPSTLSMVYILNDFILDESQGEKKILVRDLSLSPRLFSNKGMLEHTTGGVVDRVIPL